MTIHHRPIRSGTARAAAAALLAALLASPGIAQAPSEKDGKGGTPSSLRSRDRSKKFSSTPAPAKTAPPAPGGPSTPAAAPAKADGAKKEPEAAAGEPGKPIIERAVDFLVGNAVVVVVAILAGGAGVTFLVLRTPGGKKKEKLEEEPAPAVAVRPKATEEDDGPRRVLVTPGASKPAAKPKDDKDYALVVNEEDLKMPPLPEEGVPGRKVDAAAIEELIAKEKFSDAYREYVQKIESDGTSELSPEVERRLGSHFLKSGDLEKAGRVLEHHVATHHAPEILPETYFDLAYIHFRTNTLAKSKRYFRLFADHHKDPAFVERARKVLSKLERVQNLN